MSQPGLSAVRKRLPWIVAGLLLVIAAWLSFSPDEPVDHERRIRDALARTALAAEQQDLDGVLEFVSENFKNDAGDQNALRAFLFVQLRRGAWRKIFLVDTDVHLTPGEPVTHATVSTGAVIAGVDTIKRVEDLEEGDHRAGSYRIDLELALEDGAWRAISANHRDADLEDLLGL